MPVESEKVTEKKLRDEVESLGGLCIKMISTHLNGLPDRLCLFPNGAAVFVEVKSTGDTPKRLQRIMHKNIRKLGFPVYWIDSQNQIPKIIEHGK